MTTDRAASVLAGLRNKAKENGITAFIEPVWEAFLKEEEFQKQWSAEKKDWDLMC